MCVQRCVHTQNPKYFINRVTHSAHLGVHERTGHSERESPLRSPPYRVLLDSNSAEKSQLERIFKMFKLFLLISLLITNTSYCVKYVSLDVSVEQSPYFLTESSTVGGKPCKYFIPRGGVLTEVVVDGSQPIWMPIYDEEVLGYVRISTGENATMLISSVVKPRRQMLKYYNLVENMWVLYKEFDSFKNHQQKAKKLQENNKPEYNPKSSGETCTNSDSGPEHPDEAKSSEQERKADFSSHNHSKQDDDVALDQDKHDLGAPSGGLRRMVSRINLNELVDDLLDLDAEFNDSDELLQFVNDEYNMALEDLKEIEEKKEEEAVGGDPDNHEKNDPCKNPRNKKVPKESAVFKVSTDLDVLNTFQVLLKGDRPKMETSLSSIKEEDPSELIEYEKSSESKEGEESVLVGGIFLDVCKCENCKNKGYQELHFVGHPGHSPADVEKIEDPNSSNPSTVRSSVYYDAQDTITEENSSFEKSATLSEVLADMAVDDEILEAYLEEEETENSEIVYDIFGEPFDPNKFEASHDDESIILSISDSSPDEYLDPIPLPRNHQSKTKSKLKVRPVSFHSTTEEKSEDFKGPPVPFPKVIIREGSMPPKPRPISAPEPTQRKESNKDLLESEEKGDSLKPAEEDKTHQNDKQQSDESQTQEAQQSQTHPSETSDDADPKKSKKRSKDSKDDPDMMNKSNKLLGQFLLEAPTDNYPQKRQSQHPLTHFPATLSDYAILKSEEKKKKGFKRYKDTLSRFFSKHNSYSSSKNSSDKSKKSSDKRSSSQESVSQKSDKPSEGDRKDPETSSEQTPTPTPSYPPGSPPKDLGARPKQFPVKSEPSSPSEPQSENAPDTDWKDRNHIGQKPSEHTDENKKHKKRKLTKEEREAQRIEDKIKKDNLKKLKMTYKREKESIKRRNREIEELTKELQKLQSRAMKRRNIAGKPVVRVSFAEECDKNELDQIADNLNHDNIDKTSENKKDKKAKKEKAKPKDSSRSRDKQKPNGSNNDEDDLDDIGKNLADFYSSQVRDNCCTVS